MSNMSAMKKRLIKTLAESISGQVELFNTAEVECLIRDYNERLGEPTSPGKGAPGLDRVKFRSILQNTFGISDDIMMDRVFRKFDKDNDSSVSTKEWIEGLSIFLRGSLDDKIKFCFRVYDLNDDTLVSMEEMYHMLKNCLPGLPTKEERDEGVKDLVEITFKKMDRDHDGRLSFSDFEQSVKEENLLLEAFGTCLPNFKRVEAFEQRVFRELQK
ncbi:calaxin [Gasterosteus aculeatus]|uniref:EF-hand domain-containing protein n=1 Tax=Gasterosteus aculeatus aculeatus TaxID=481459 RepID=G3NQN6_GASAC|nr:EF-hand calcium-binding domain-containing protein 1 [Gasterosteus aculeatus aculeatus]